MHQRHRPPPLCASCLAEPPAWSCPRPFSTPSVTARSTSAAGLRRRAVARWRGAGAWEICSRNGTDDGSSSWVPRCTTSRAKRMPNPVLQRAPSMLTAARSVLVSTSRRSPSGRATARSHSALQMRPRRALGSRRSKPPPRRARRTLGSSRRSLRRSRPRRPRRAAQGTSRVARTGSAPAGWRSAAAARGGVWHSATRSTSGTRAGSPSTRCVGWGLWRPAQTGGWRLGSTCALPGRLP